MNSYYEDLAKILILAIQKSRISKTVKYLVMVSLSFNFNFINFRQRKQKQPLYSLRHKLSNDQEIQIWFESQMDQ